MPCISSSRSRGHKVAHPLSAPPYGVGAPLWESLDPPLFDPLVPIVESTDEEAEPECIVGEWTTWSPCRAPRTYKHVLLDEEAQLNEKNKDVEEPVRFIFTEYRIQKVKIVKKPSLFLVSEHRTNEDFLRYLTEINHNNK